MRKGVSAIAACIIGFLSVLFVGTGLTAETQLIYTGCINKAGRIVRVAAGDSPKKPCKAGQTEITLSAKKEIDALLEKDAALTATDQALMEEDTVLRKRMGELEEQIDVLTQCVGAERYVDLGLTVFDCQTRLEWEKKLPETTDTGFTDCILKSPGDVSCVGRRYSWSTCSGPDPEYPALGDCPPDGTAFTVFLAELNTPPCFAGHCDWRLPEMQTGGIRLDGTKATTAELETIPDGEHPIFGPGQASGGTGYLSSITVSFDLAFAYNSGGPGGKTAKVDFARAVRTGP